MVSNEDIERFLLKINPFAEKVPDITEKISKLEDDEEFQKLLKRLVTVGEPFHMVY